MQVLGKILLGLGITVMFVILVMSGKEFLYDNPRYDDYIQEPRPPAEIKTQEECEQIGGRWNSVEPAPVRPLPPQESQKPEMPPEEINERTGWCDQDFEKREAYDKAREDYERNTFIGLTLIGMLAFIGGVISVTAKAASSSAPSIGGGLAVGGIIVTIIGSAGYWSDMDPFFRFILSAIGFAIIIAVTVLIPKIIKRMSL